MKGTLLAIVGSLALTAVAVPPTMNLSGEWQVALGDAKPVAVTLPGTLGDAKLGPAAEKAVYGALTPRHQYVGPATYTKTITVTPEMTGDYELFMERVMWKSTVTIDDTALGSCDSLATPHVYAIPARLLTPGTHTLTITIDNSLIHPIGEKSHSYGDSMQTRWNGVIGEFALRPRNPLRQARVFAPFGNEVTVRLPKLSHPVNDTIEGLQIEGKPVVAELENVPAEMVKATADTLVLRVPGAKPWSEFDPQLYTLVLRWNGLEHRIRFGFRSFEVKGNRLYMNGKPFFVRGNTENCHFPLTGYPAMDKAAWLRIFSILKGQGVNQIRCHSWSVPQAAFDAADELGLLVSPEIVWIDANWMTRDHKYLKGIGKGPKDVDDFIHNELFRILDAYGNAPSFFSMSVGNELGAADFNLLGKWMEECRAYDGRHLYAASSARQISSGDDFYITHNYPGVGMMRERRRDGTDWDYEDVYRRTKIPTIAHEIGQWPVFPNFDREIPKYTGILRPWNLENLREDSVKAGVLRFNDAYARASLMTNRLMYKDEIESFMRTPSCAGLQLLGVQDYSGQGEALIGWLDSFYDVKPGAERAVPVADYFAPVAMLARFPKYTWRSDETFTAKLVVHNYGPEPINGPFAWSIPALGQSGSFGQTVQPGAVQQVGTISCTLSNLKAPAKIELTFGDNKWPLWVYPAEVPADVPAGVTLTDDPAEAKAALAKGGRVLFDAHACPNPKATIFSSFRPVYWGTTWFPGQRQTTLGMVVQDKSPAFAAFPTEDWQDWQWQHLVNGATTFRITGASEDFTPLAMPIVDFHKPALAALLFETAVGPGKLLVSGVDLTANRPEAKQLRRSLLDYVASDAFAPKAAIAEKDLWGLFYDARANLAPRPAEYKNAVVYIECAALLNRQNQDTPWEAKRDRAELVAGTYAITGRGLRTWADKDGKYWVGDDLTITLKNCSNVRGKLLVRFRDPNNNGRTAKGSFDGNRSFNVPRHAKGKGNPDGSYWVELPVDMEDFLDGKLELRIQKTSGPNFMIDRLIILPNEA